MAAVFATMLHDAVMTPAEGETFTLKSLLLTFSNCKSASLCSCEAAHADVLQPLQVGICCSSLHLPSRGLEGILPLVLHTGDDEHPVPGGYGQLVQHVSVAIESKA